MEKTKAPKRTRTKATIVPGRSRITCWLSAEACHKLDLAVIQKKSATGKRDVEFGDVIEEMLLEKFSSLSLVVTHVDRSPRPAGGVEHSNGDSSTSAEEISTAQSEN